MSSVLTTEGSRPTIIEIVRDVQAAKAFVDKHRRRRQSNKVLYGHPSPVHWTEQNVPMDAVLRTRERTNRAIPKRVNLYVGTPYCLPTDPDRCGFCLFPTEIYTGQRQLEEYLEHLEREGDLFRDHFAGAELASIYFGGGTSNLYKPHQYARLMEIVGGVFDIPADIEVTLEGIPQTFSHDKLLAMKQCGMNRISMGVQQLDEELIKASGRKSADRPGVPDPGVLPGARSASQRRPHLRLAQPDHGPDGRATWRRSRQPGSRTSPTTSSTSPDAPTSPGNRRGELPSPEEQPRDVPRRQVRARSPAATPR